MKTALLLLLFCLAEADDIRQEFQQFKRQLEGQHAALTLEMTQLKNDLTLEITQLKSEVKKLKYQCPIGWTKFGDSCYYIPTEKKTWQKGREYCQNQGADLVVINSRKEQDFVDSLVGRDTTVFIGLTDRETEGRWKWVDGTPLTTTYWGPGEPNDGWGEEDCAVFHNGGWNDIACGSIQLWMCEIVF